MSKTIAILVVVTVVVLSSLGAYFVLVHHNPNTCVQSAASSVYLTIENDSAGARLQNLTVSGEVKWVCGSSTGNFVASQNIGKLYTPSNGAVFVGSVIGNYSLTLSYKGTSYPVKFASGAEQNVNVTVLIPSNHLSVIGCVFGDGVCFNETNPNDITLITTSSVRS
jgi:hypothetical protein